MLIEKEKSLIVACDVFSLSQLSKLVKETRDVEFVQAYKVGMTLSMRHGLPIVVNTIRKYTKKKIIFDYQKAGCDIPPIGSKFANICAESGVDAVILFPLAGAETETEWIRACKSEGLHVIVGGEMTHPKFLKAEGGFIDDGAPFRIYDIALTEGVRDFVVPGNRVDKIRQYKIFFDGCKDRMEDNFVYALYSPGLITQGGEITEAGEVAGNRWHCIVGRAIYEADNIKKKALEIAKQL